jgi:ribosomal protein S18 acetylase RimI-like enzyme
MSITIRPYHPSDLAELQRITVAGFDGIAIDQSVEKLFGPLGDKDWCWRKAQHVVEDCTVNPAGVFVAEEDGRVLGWVSTRVDHEGKKGRIPNLAVDSAERGRGLGRKLVEHALDHLRREGMAFAMIETMVNNPIGQHLYPSCGFVEVSRQIHFAAKL